MKLFVRKEGRRGRSWVYAITPSWGGTPRWRGMPDDQETITVKIEGSSDGVTWGGIRPPNVLFYDPRASHLFTDAAGKNWWWFPESGMEP